MEPLMRGASEPGRNPGSGREWGAAGTPRRPQAAPSPMLSPSCAPCLWLFGLPGWGRVSALGYLTEKLLFQYLQVIDFCFPIYLRPPNWPRC